MWPFTLALLAAFPFAAGAGAQTGTPQAATRASRHAAPNAEQVSGRVVSAADGHGIPRAVVTLSPVRTGIAGEPASTLTTDAEGRFHGDPLPAGKYHLAATAHGYTASSYQEHGGFSTAIVLGAGYAVDRLELALVPSAEIHGHVMDNNGDPVSNAQVTLYRESTNGEQERVNRFRATQADEDGNYELAELPAGKYYLAVTATPWYAMHARSEAAAVYPQYRPNVDPALDVAYPTIFYPHAVSDKEATPIPLRGGEQMAANFTLAPVHAVTVTLQTAASEPGVPPSQAQVQPQLLRRAFGTHQFVPAQMERDSDGWRLTGVAPGDYDMQAVRGGGRFTTPAQPVSIGSAPMTLPLPAAGAVAKVTVTPHLQDDAALPPHLQVVLRRGPGEGRASQQINDKGIAEFAEVPAGDYRMEAFGGGRPLTVATLTVAGQPVPDRRLHVTGGDVAVDVALQPAVRSVDGVAVREGKPAGGAMVILVPAGEDTADTLFRRDQSDMDGSFTLNNIPAGNYLLLAVENAWEMRWTDLPTLTPYLSHAVPLTISSSGSARVNLTEAIPVQTR